MAVLEKLNLQSIRSFGSDAQTIHFEPPFTLILGQNGCGKTTIIESLKYAVTGGLPLGQGGSFIRDPKLDRCVESYGQVKLQFVSAQGKQLVITRSLQATQKYRKLEVKTIDVTISTKDKKQMSGRCADMDDYMSVVFGVSKPILNNVIFCHQEDSHWPLDEGKKVKERFDEIFDVTKYNKCMIKIIEARKTVLKEISEMKTAIEFLKENMNKAIEKKSTLEENERRYNTLENEVKSYENDIKMVEKDHGCWYTKQKQFTDLDKKRDTLKFSLKTYLENQETERKEITILFKGSKEELERTIKDLEDQLGAKKRASSATASKIKEIKTSESTALAQASSIKMGIGRLENEVLQGRNLLTERNNKINELALLCGLTALNESASEIEFNELSSRIDETCRKLQEDIEKTNQNQKKESQELQSKINRCLEEKTKLESEIRSKKSNIGDNETQLEETSDLLSVADAEAENKVKLDAELEKQRNALDETIRAVDTKTLSKEIEELRTECKSLEDRQGELIKEVQSLNKHASARNNLNELDKKLTSLKDNVRKSRAKSDDAIKRLLSNSTDNTIKADFDEMYNTLKREIQHLTQDQSLKEKNVSLLELERKQLKHEIDLKQQELREIEENAYQLLERGDYETVLKTVDADIEKAQSNKAVFTSAEYLFKGYIEKLQKTPCCPLCKRNFDKEEEVSELVRDLRGKVTTVPSRLKEILTKLESLQKRQRKLLQFRPVQDRINQLSQDIPNLKEKLSSIETKLDEARHELAVAQASLVLPTENLDHAESMQTDVYDIDRNQRDIRSCNKEVEKWKASLPLTGSYREPEQVYAEQQEVQTLCNQKRNEREALEKRLRAHDELTNRLRERVNRITADLLAIDKTLQGREKLKERQSELANLIPVLQSELQDLQARLVPAEQRKRDAEDALKKADIEYRHKVRALENKLKEREKERVIANKLQNDYTRYEMKQVPHRLKAEQAKCQEAEEQHQKLVKKREETEEELTKLTRDIEGFEGQKSQLKRNLQYKKYEENVIKFQQELEKIEEEIGNIDIEGIRNKLYELEERRDELVQEKSNKIGMLKELSKVINENKRELGKAPLLNAEKKYKEKYIDLTVKKHVERDLQSYLKALEYAMQHFHKDRMDSINKTIRELWRQIYRGNDIDFIEIKTDEIGTATVSSGSDKKRSYNYRVVQVKNGTELDMRGRCSAGQKVLACIIIRIALAEMFSANCGILTLDEPTTNLDKQNICSLSDAITEIVQEHLGRKNFQLIVITHDRAFLDRMSRADFFSHYWEVSRSHQSTSLIKRVDVQD